MEFTVDKHIDKCMDSMLHVTVTNISTGQHATTTCDKKRSGRIISGMKKALLHG